jgi:hypothetical protein
VALCPINRNTLSKDFPLNKRWLSANQEQHGLKGAEHQVKYGFKTTFSEAWPVTPTSGTWRRTAGFQNIFALF